VSRTAVTRGRRRALPSRPQAPQEPDIRGRLGVRPLINLTGTLTAFGGISARPEAIEAAAAIMARGVDIVELQARASQVVAEVTGAEAGFVAACSSAGICMGVAGAMTGADLARIERLPDTSGMRDEVILQTGHKVNYGHAIAQDVRQTGARLVEVGDVNAAKPHQLEAALGPDTAAGLYVVSHHCVAYGQIPFADFARICHGQGVPVIVDLAAEYDLRSYLTEGADLTIHSSHKFLGGATAGIVAGRRDLVRAAFLQNWGIARPMKVGKEGVASALAALQSWVTRDHAAERAQRRRQLELWRRCLAPFAGITATIDPDPTANPFDRLKVRVDAAVAGLSAVELVRLLETGEPPIAVRSHQLELGEFVMDPRSLADGEPELVADRLVAILDAARDGSAEAAPGEVARWRAAKARALADWPDIL
jgi:D-glucosaminate-6-phosphate ammonia-lyase